MGATINEVMRFFFKYFTNVIPVMGDDGLIKGLLSKDTIVKFVGEKIELDGHLREQIDNVILDVGSDEFDRLLQMLLRDGKVSFVPVIDEDGNFVDVVHKSDLFMLSKSRMVVSKEKLSRMFESLPLATLGFSSTGVITYCNKQAEDIIGRSPIGKKLQDVFHLHRSGHRCSGEVAVTDSGRLVMVYGDTFAHNGLELGGFLFVEDISLSFFWEHALKVLSETMDDVILFGVGVDGRLMFGGDRLYDELDLGKDGTYEDIFSGFPEALSLVRKAFEHDGKVDGEVKINNKSVYIFLSPVSYGKKVIGVVGGMKILSGNIDSNLRIMVKHTERRMIERALKEADYNISRAAKILGIPRQTLQYKIKTLGLNNGGSEETKKG